MTNPPVSQYLKVGHEPWEERRPGIHWKVLWRDGDQPTVLVRYDAVATVPRHRHLGEEQISVDTGICLAGDFARRGAGPRGAPEIVVTFRASTVAGRCEQWGASTVSRLAITHRVS